MTQFPTTWRLAAVVLALGALAPAARAEVPIPRPALSQASQVLEASVSAVPWHVGPRLPIEQAIAREASADVDVAVAKIYAANDYRPLWQSERAAVVRARLGEAAGDGLDPADYRVPVFADTVVGRARADVALTEALARYGRHASRGRIDPQDVSRIIDYGRRPFNAASFVRRVANARDPIALMERAHPAHPQFLALRDALRATLTTRFEPAPAVGRGRNLKAGVSDPRVAVLRARLGATVRRGTDPTRFDERLAAAVRVFQRENGLRADGIVGPATVRALDGERGEDPTRALIANLERWRWMPRELGERHVFVNIPAFRVRIMDGATTAYDGKVIVGTPSNPTPVFSDAMEHIVVNPYWNVPYSIASNEMLGGIRANPSGYFARRGYEAVVNGRVVNPASVNWNRDMLRRVRIRQRPGRRNALGSVKFMFPNDHAVYLHDTPTKHLFSRARRAYSHGCVRVDQPFDFAEALLAAEPDLSGRGLRRMVGGGQRWLKLATHIPVHLAYFTMEVRADGTLVRHGDVYGFDSRTLRDLAS